MKELVKQYWQVTLQQDANKMREFFREDATICWHNTNEVFTVEEYIKANCEYPNDWQGKVERLEAIDNLVISVTNVYTKDKSMVFQAVSFIKIINAKIISIDEYWGEDGEPPSWRKELKIGKSIKEMKIGEKYDEDR